jgi:hypothetical protein
VSTANAGAIVVVVLLIVGAVIAASYGRRRRVEELHDKFGPEYDRTVQAMGDETKAQTELQERQKRVEALHIRPLSASERDRYGATWTDVQARFVDAPAAAIADADHLIAQVMETRGYPVSDFERRAADISVNYPALVNNYRAAREIAVRNEQQQASTEDLRQAMIHYRSLFEELLGAEETVMKERSI